MDEEAIQPVYTRAEVDAVVLARALSYAHNGGWAGKIIECLSAVDIVADPAHSPTILGEDWGETAFPPLGAASIEAYRRAQSLVGQALDWAEAQDPPLCSLVERVMAAIGLGPWVHAAETRPSQL